MHLSDILPVSVEKGRVIIRYKLAQLIKSTLGGELASCSHVSSITRRSRTRLSRSHVSSMTGGCTYPINYRGVVSIEK